MKIGNLTFLASLLVSSSKGVFGANTNNLRKFLSSSSTDSEHAADSTTARDLIEFLSSSSTGPEKRGLTHDSLCDGVFPDPGTFILPATVGSTNYCYKIELKVGGGLSVDTEDEGCTSYNAGNAYGGSLISDFEDFGGQYDHFFLFEGGKWDGNITLEVDPLLTEATLDLLASFDIGLFEGTLTIPSCSSGIVGRTRCEGSIPVGQTYILPAEFTQGNNFCFKIQLGEGGNIAVNTKDAGCASGVFGESDARSTYDYDFPGGIFYSGKWQGPLYVDEDKSLSEPILELGPDFSQPPKWFEGTLVLPSCESE